jgi:hypothetical protein
MLAASLLIPASAQSVGPHVYSAAAPSDTSQPNTQTIRDRADQGEAGSSVSSVSRGPMTAPSPSPLDSKEFVQHFVAEKLALWQQRLKLSDWQVSWSMAHRSDLKPHTVGQIHWDSPSKSATILVLDPSEYRMQFPAMLDDMELTIVHELVHLKLTSLPHSEASRGSEEQAVNGISEALFALDHKKQ